MFLVYFVDKKRRKMIYQRKALKTRKKLNTVILLLVLKGEIWFGFLEECVVFSIDWLVVSSFVKLKNLKHDGLVTMNFSVFSVFR